MDDYTFIVDSLNFKLAHLTPQQLLATLFYPHGEHVIFFGRLTGTLDYHFEGELNFRTLFFVGNATLVGTAYVLYRMARQGGLSVLQTLPIFWLLFQPQYYENTITITWAICALQHIPALFFAFWAFYLLAQASSRSFVFSLPLAFMATFSNGNGLAVLVAGFFIVLLRRQPKQVFVWLLFCALSGWLYYYLSQFSAAAPVSGNLTHPLRVLGGFFLMSGSMGLLFTHSLVSLSLTGIGLTLLFSIVTTTTIIRYLEQSHWLRQLPARFQNILDKWSIATVQPVSLALIAGYLYLIITLLGIAFARGQGWHYALLLPRFIWFATVAVVVGYLLVMLWLQSVFRPTVGWVIFSVSVFFNIASYWLTFDEMLAVRQSLVSDLHNWRENKRLVTLPANKQNNDSFYTALMAAAIREEVYHMPPVSFKPDSVNKMEVKSAGAIITKDSSFRLDERSYRYLTISANLLPHRPFTINETYLLMRSNQHTFMWPINQSHTKLAQFLLTGRFAGQGPMAIVMTDLLPSGIYKPGIAYVQNGHWTAIYSNQRLTVAR